MKLKVKQRISVPCGDKDCPLCGEQIEAESIDEVQKSFDKINTPQYSALTEQEKPKEELIDYDEDPFGDYDDWVENDWAEYEDWVKEQLDEEYDIENMSADYNELRAKLHNVVFYIERFPDSPSNKDYCIELVHKLHDFFEREDVQDRLGCY